MRNDDALRVRGSAPEDFPVLPFSEAVAALERRGIRLTPSGHWTELWQDAHQTAFTVARSAGYDILGDIHAAVLKSRESGITFAQFQKELVPLLRQKGWWGRTEDGVQLGSPRRLRTIYDVNMRTSAAQGNWERQQRLKESRPYLRYTALMDGKTRPLHRLWHGTILPVDHPWWKTHYPPNGWRCRCGAEDLSEDDLARFGYRVNDAPPDEGSMPWIHPETGEIVDVPRGIDPGWDYNPGATDHAAHASRVAMDKLADLPPEIGARAAVDLAFAFPQVEAELAEWIDGIALAAEAGEFRATGARRVVGAFGDDVLRYLADKNITPATAAISMGDADLLHALRTAKAAPLPTSIWKRLPSLLAAPAAIYWDLQNPGLVYVLDEPEGQGKFVVLVNYKIRMARTRAQTNTVRTGRRIHNLEEFDNPGRYARIK